MFAFDVGRLLSWIESQGYQATWGESWRSQVEAWINALVPGCTLQALKNDLTINTYSTPVGGYGIQNSLHCERLAVDLNIFIDGKLVEDKATLQPIGDYWESLSPMNHWGGNFTTRPDTDHFERRPT